MAEAGGMRIDEVLISVETYAYRLRIAVALLDEHNRTIMQSQATKYVEVLLKDLLEGAEDASSAIRHEQDQAQAGLGTDQREPSSGRGDRSGSSCPYAD